VTGCVALNSSVTGTFQDTETVGAVMGNSNGTNCYYYNNMTISPGTAAGYDGAPVESGTDGYNGQAWWSTAAPNGPGFNFTTNGAWEWGTDNLPKLKSPQP
jgi:hypothetical protein